MKSVPSITGNTNLSQIKNLCFFSNPPILIVRYKYDDNSTWSFQAVFTYTDFMWQIGILLSFAILVLAKDRVEPVSNSMLVSILQIRPVSYDTHLTLLL